VGIQIERYTSHTIGVRTFACKTKGEYKKRKACLGVTNAVHIGIQSDGFQALCGSILGHLFGRHDGRCQNHVTIVEYYN